LLFLFSRAVGQAVGQAREMCNVHFVLTPYQYMRARGTSWRWSRRMRTSAKDHAYVTDLVPRLRPSAPLLLITEEKHPAASAQTSTSQEWTHWTLISSLNHLATSP
jgi:hypothetical protein